jgi:hypothetical protein
MSVAVSDPRFNDFQFGLTGERTVIHRIADFLGTPVALDGGTGVLDVHSATQCGEIKSRRYKSTAFNDWMIGLNKIEAMTDESKSYHIFFNLMDGLFAVPYDKERFATLMPEDFKRERNYAYDKVQSVVYIPRDWFIPVP